MKPNLARIPADGEALAREILERCQGSITDSFLDSLDDSCSLDLGRYGVRQATVALRTGSAGLLREALLAAALAALFDKAAGGGYDPRDTMVGLAIHVNVARMLGLTPAVLFDEVADVIPAGDVGTLLRTFDARSDVTLQAFGWRLVETPDGPDFVPI